MHDDARQGSSGLTALLRTVVGAVKASTGADIVVLVLYDEATHRYYAPVADGVPEEGLQDSLADMQEQLRKYQSDAGQGKVPEELHVRQYGITVWLTETRQMLISRDAPTEIDSTFVRRHQIASLIGLPLLYGSNLLGLLHLNFRAPAEGQHQPEGGRIPDQAGLQELQHAADRAAEAVHAEVSRAETAALDGTRRLAALLGSPDAADGEEPSALRRRLSIALSDLLLASSLDAAAVYQFDGAHASLELLSAHLPVAAPLQVHVPAERDRWRPALEKALAEAAADANLVPVHTLRLGGSRDPLGYIVILSRDPLARLRLPRPTDVLLQAATDLIAGTLSGRRLIASLEKSNQLLNALSRMSQAMLRPGASRQQVIDAVARQLTDATVPEFDFDFASAFLVDDAQDGGLAVRMASGSSTSDTIDAAAVHGDSRPARIPTWALPQERPLAPDDVLVYVATRWQSVLVGALAHDGEPEEVAGYAAEQLRWVTAPVVRGDGSRIAEVSACLIEEPGGATAPQDSSTPFTLAGDIFEASGHGDLIRVFVPFGLDRRRRATGVLEVGYHRTASRRPDRTQVEAVRAAAMQIAIAVDTARLYEEVQRHAEQVELNADVSKAIASSIDLDQTLRVVARNLVRLVEASACQIALADEDRSGWYGAAASDREQLWQRQRGERPDRSFVLEALDRREPLVIEDVRSSDLVPDAYARTFDVRSLLALPLLAGDEAIGVAVLTQADQQRRFTAEEVQRAQGLAHQAAVAIKHARLHSQAEEERHIQKDFILLGFGMWGQQAYRHLLTLKQFFNFRTHVVEREREGAHDALADKEREVVANGDAFYWDSDEDPAHEQLARQLETSPYVITYIATPAATHLPMLARYYHLSDVMVIEKPLGASPEEYRRFLDTAPAGVELVAADHYYFKLEVRLLQQLLSEERTLRDFLNEIEEVRIEILESRPLTGAASEIGVVADLIPHAFAIVSLLTPLDRLELDPTTPLQVGRHEPLQGERETYARMQATFPYL
ncbi:MAG TPA: GAF domain-containing protein, partial [Candidatus Binatia bacterium]|nr:GAF domain-containing protein [Candidatus Binatia bacterium]